MRRNGRDCQQQSRDNPRGRAIGERGERRNAFDFFFFYSNYAQSATLSRFFLLVKK